MEGILPSKYEVNVSIDTQSSLYLGAALGTSIILGIVIGFFLVKLLK